jgi:hypothetical protein
VLALTHASAGAIVGEFVPNPYLTFIIAVFLHLIMDKIPHFWPENEKHRGTIIAVDTLLSALFILGLFLWPETKSASVVAGALGGVSVDFFLVLVCRSKGRMAEWHTNRQPHKPQSLWLLTDIFFFTSLVYLIWLFR